MPGNYRTLADEFRSEWAAGSGVPDLWAFLSRHPHASARELAEVVLVDQQRREQAGCPLPAERYLAGTPVLAADPELKLDIVYGEYHAARAAGRALDVAGLLARFPELAAALRDHLEFDAALTTDHSVRPEEPVVEASGIGMPAAAPPGYEFIRELGRGGFGNVWLARHAALDKLVAVKHLRGGAPVSDDAPLVREARTMADLKIHPNRVTVFDLVRTESGWFLVMDYIDGGPLSHLMAPNRPLDWLRAARYVAEAADGLVEVHERGILHRDIKPDNILLDRERDAALLTDFGLAVQASSATGCCGTPGYMAPELFEGAVSAKSDAFALAATLYHLVTGRKPFDSRQILVGQRQAAAGLPVGAFAGLPPRLQEILRAGLEPEPARRVDLASFIDLLRGCRNAGLAERLQGASSREPNAPRLNVVVSTATEKDLVFRTVFSGTIPDSDSDSAVSVHCDEVVRIEAAAAAEGYLTVLNLSSSGEVAVLLPNPRVPDNRVQPGQPRRLTVKLTPPAGTDHAVLVWTPRPCLLSASEWREQIERGRLVLPSLRERGMEFVALDTPEADDSNWVAAMIGIEHGEMGGSP